MTKPHKSTPPASQAVNQKAPKARQSEAPFELKRKAPPAQTPERAGSKGNAYPLKSGAASEAYGARISRRAADRLRAGHSWVYASDIESIELGDDAPSALLPVADSRGLLLGTALYSPSSLIALRMISREVVDEEEWLR